jgi:hypothetical protein
MKKLLVCLIALVFVSIPVASSAVTLNFDDLTPGTNLTGVTYNGVLSLQRYIINYMVDINA